MNDKALSTIGLCRRAGKLVIGFDAVTAELKGGKHAVKGVILADDLSEKTKKEIRFHCEKTGVATAEPGITLDGVKDILGKRCGIIAVLDEGLFASISRTAK